MEQESLTVKGEAVARNSTPHPSPGLIHSPLRQRPTAGFGLLPWPYADTALVFLTPFTQVTPRPDFCLHPAPLSKATPS